MSLNKKLASRITKAHFEEEKSLEAFGFNFNLKVPARYVRDLATCQFIERKESIIFCGPVGVGKTHLAQALEHQACRQGYSVLFTKANEFGLENIAISLSHSKEYAIAFAAGEAK